MGARCLYTRPIDHGCESMSSLSRRPPLAWSINSNAQVTITHHKSLRATFYDQIKLTLSLSLSPWALGIYGKHPPWWSVRTRTDPCLLLHVLFILLIDITFVKIRTTAALYSLPDVYKSMATAGFSFNFYYPYSQIDRSYRSYRCLVEIVINELWRSAQGRG